ncbi:class I SAM-dependent methyltransferase [Candidatus Azambacteria bacterium]|nr:class I SAM-dependent methyltransferase [Candidatus Azambacteria bacterium]
MKRVWRVLKKIMKGEDVLTVRQSAEAWDKQFREGKWDFLVEDIQKQGHAVLIGMMCRSRAMRGDITVLDIGCGNGIVARMVRSMCGEKCRYFGIDISQAALDGLKKEDPDAVLVCADANDPPPFIEKFDVIIFSEVLLYLDFRNILDRYRDLLSKDGVIIFSLYDSWRTKMIVRNMRTKLQYISSYIITNEQSGITWTVAMAQLPNPS